MDDRPTHLDLFSGIGGFALAARWAGFRTIGFCEIDKYCQKVLEKNFMAYAVCERRQQIARGPHGDEASHERRSTELHHELAGCGESRRPRIHSDILDLDGHQFAGVDLITGGFPCQPFSVAGKRRGAADYRHLWPKMLRVIKEARPAWVLGENVPGIIPMELDNVLSGLESIGYATRTFVIPACAVDARHRRDRLWIVGRLVANVSRIQQGRKIEWAKRERARSESESMADADGDERNWRSCDVQIGRVGIESETSKDRNARGIKWLAEPDVGRVAHGVPSRVDRLRGLGNAIVPQVAFEILREIRQLVR